MADLTTIKFDGTRSMHEHEIRVHVPLPSISKDGNPPIVEPFNNEEHPMNNPQLHNEIIANESMDATPAEPTLRRSQRQRRSAISNYYMLYQLSKEENVGEGFVTKLLLSNLNGSSGPPHCPLGLGEDSTLPPPLSIAFVL
ncbi:hypothetical protein SADUNF_Sadunf07G0065600 [Salix dunnii]|uniref:Uncharacterized protein n=1 Tax=Salix dunnii TaxID=1413687 RepID=A0A835MTW8_9ROSI|nr:hypothetical protein SADUNF_Sadunf07G0065600 [Salix dunnii]